MKEIKYSTVDHIHIHKLCKPIFPQAINLALLEKNPRGNNPSCLILQGTT